MSAARRWHDYPAADPLRRPSPWWYYGRAVYVSRRDYFKIYAALMLALGIPMVVLALRFDLGFWKGTALGAGVASLIYLGYSLLGLYRMYGHPGRRYVDKLLAAAGAADARTVADLHIGTYRHSYLLADALPDATVHSVDCWGVAGDPHEAAVRDVRALEPPPVDHPRIIPTRADAYALPLADGSCDLVCFGFGTHEIPDDGPLETVFAEARRVLRPGGKAVMFEHGTDFHNVIIFGPVIGHVIPRHGWADRFRRQFAEVGYARSGQAVDLFWGTKAEPVGTAATELPGPFNRRNWTVWAVIGTVMLVSLGVVAHLPTAYLVSMYLFIAAAGLLWPWLMIGVAVAADRLARPSPVPAVSADAA
jgi:SAM-dependent methyltransferase